MRSSSGAVYAQHVVLRIQTKRIPARREFILVDEVTAVGDIRFRRRCEEALLARRERGTLVMTSHDPHTPERFCNRGAVLYRGALVFYDSVTEACEVHHALQMREA